MVRETERRGQCFKILFLVLAKFPCPQKSRTPKKVNPLSIDLKTLFRTAAHNFKTGNQNNNTETYIHYHGDNLFQDNLNSNYLY